jgi:signal transduction histidine kinase
MIDVASRGVPPWRILIVGANPLERAAAKDALVAGSPRQCHVVEATRFESQFLATMSHELRSPLTGIIGFADLLQMGTVVPGSPQCMRYLGHIGSCGRQLLRLIDDLLDLAKVESGLVRFFPEPLDLTALMLKVRDILRSEAEHKQLQVTIDIDAGLGPLLLDPARLEQVLYSYLSNAIKFTPAGGHVTLRARPEGDQHVRIEVEDSGIGIAAADLPQLFTSYRQLDAGAARHKQGAGLGLALTHRLVQAQQGTVGVSSTPGVGSVFHLVLNRQHGSDAARNPPEAHKAHEAPEAHEAHQAPERPQADDQAAAPASI